MSQPPPHPDPLVYATPPLRLPSPRPTSVTVLAIIAIAWGSLATLASLLALVQYLGINFGPNPVMDALRRDRLVLSVSVGGIVVRLILSIALLWSGIGSLALKPAARLMMIWYAILDIAASVALVLVNLAVVNPRTEQIMLQVVASNPQLNTPAMKSIMRISSYGGIVLALLLLVWPGLILYFMTRPRVKDAFRRGLGAAALQGGPYPATSITEHSSSPHTGR
jgi:hypothetical protein